MGYPIVGKRVNFRPVKRRSNFYRVMLYLSLILAGLWVMNGLNQGTIEPAFLATPTATRLAASYVLEGEAFFNAGKLDDPSNQVTPIPLDIYMATAIATHGPDSTPPTPTPIPVVNDAIEAYQAAARIEPNNPRVWYELARIQAYSSTMLSNDRARYERLEEALASARQAVELAPDESNAHAILAFVLDWYAFNPFVATEEGRTERLLAEASTHAVRAYNLDPNNALALAYYAEILIDQQRWGQAEQYARQAIALDPNSMDAYRSFGVVLESTGSYRAAIDEYLKASNINPNMTFLYINIGRNYRRLGQNTLNDPDNPFIERALYYFDRAASINASLGVDNPVPYIEIARTYVQVGQFLVASNNAKKALSFNPYEASIYGQLGQIFIRARNYEGAVPLLQCAVEGCTAEENELGQVPVVGLELRSKTVGYYYVEYGTVLAFLSTEKINHCDRALPVLAQVRRTFPDDEILVGIAEDSEGICRRLAGAGLVPMDAQTPQP
jgi:tetratricopeptide (TPR) repeat protein